MALSFLFNPPINVKFCPPGADGKHKALAKAIAKPGVMDVLNAALGLGDDLGIITLDASIRENHSFSADVPEHPVEVTVAGQDSFVTDHYIRKARTLNITGTISDAPVQYLSALTSGDIGAGLGGMAAWSGELSRSMKAYTKLRQLWFDGEPFDIVTGFDLYQNVVFTQLDIPREAAIGRQCLFTASVKQMRIVDTDPAKTAGNDMAMKMSDLGYIANQLPDVTTMLAAAAFVGFVTYKLSGGGDINTGFVPI